MTLSSNSISFFVDGNEGDVIAYSGATNLASVRFEKMQTNAGGYWLGDITAIPEPGTYAAIFGILALGGACSCGGAGVSRRSCG